MLTVLLLIAGQKQCLHELAQVFLRQFVPPRSMASRPLVDFALKVALNDILPVFAYAILSGV